MFLTWEALNRRHLVTALCVRVAGRGMEVKKSGGGVGVGGSRDSIQGVRTALEYGEVRLLPQADPYRNVK